jgi:GNAT superfamily N-acetyltransferase
LDLSNSIHRIKTVPALLYKQNFTNGTSLSPEFGRPGVTETALEVSGFFTPTAQYTGKQALLKLYICTTAALKIAFIKDLNSRIAMAANIQIRPGTKEDARTIADFNRAMARETEDKDLSPDKIYPGVERLMARPEYGFYIVAVDEAAAGEIVGTLMITTEWSDWRNGLFWWIQSVYVAPEHRRTGIYRKMYHYIKSKADGDPDVCGYRLYVEKDNKVAQQTYQALGMIETDYLLYEEEKVS